MTIRLRVEYQRKKVVQEKGYITVDVDEFATLRDVYEAAYNQKHTERLATDEKILSEDWQYHVKQGQTHEPIAPKPAS